MYISTGIKKTKNFLDKYDIVNFGKNNQLFILFTFILIIGMITGALLAKSFNMEMLRQINFLFSSDFKARTSENFLETFVSSLSSNFFIFIIMLVLSLSFLGSILIPCLVFFRGFSLGLSAGYLYLIYSLQGIGFYLLVLLPGIFISSIVLIQISANAELFSFKYAKKILPKDTGDSLWKDFKTYFKKSSRVLGLFLISAFADASFMAMFARFFEF